MDSNIITALACCKKVMTKRLSEIIFSKKNRSIDAITVYHCILSLSKEKKRTTGESLLNLFFEEERVDGCIPSSFVSGKACYGAVPGIDKIEGNLFILTALAEHLKNNENKDFILEKWQGVSSAFNCLAQYLEKDFLLKTPIFSGYSFPFLRNRKELFLNALFCSTARAYSELCEAFSEYKEKQMAFGLYWNSRKAVDRFFWNKKFYSEVPESSSEKINLPGNFFVVANNVSLEGKEKIAGNYLSEKLKVEEFGKTFVPEYKALFLSPLFKKIYAVSGKAFFPWIASLSATAFKKIEMQEKAEEILSFTGKILNENCPEWKTGEKLANQKSLLSAAAYVNAVKTVFKK